MFRYFNLTLFKKFYYRIHAITKTKLLNIKLGMSQQPKPNQPPNQGGWGQIGGVNQNNSGLNMVPPQ